MKKLFGFLLLFVTVSFEQSQAAYQLPSSFCVAGETPSNLLQKALASNNNGSYWDIVLEILASHQQLFNVRLKTSIKDEFITVLHYAVQMKASRFVMQKLLDLGVNHALTNSHGETALQYAWIMFNRSKDPIFIEIIDQLIQRGASMNFYLRISDDVKEHVLVWAAREKFRVDLLQVFLKVSRIPDKLLGDALTMARECKNVDAIKLLNKEEEAEWDQLNKEIKAFLRMSAPNPI